MLVMDIAPTSTSPLSTTSRSPEPESETPIRIQPAIKPVSLTNGVLKRPQRHHHHQHHRHGPTVVITYRECLKNHAATLGGHALDGCGEFMPSPSATPTDPTSLKCAACGCHRNFHRREPEDPHPATTATATIEYQPHHRHHPPPPPPASHPHRSPNSASPPPISSSYYPSAPHMLLALSGGHTGALDNTHNNFHLPAAALTPNTKNLGSNSKKRFRTKFTQLQKDKMLEFAERVGWKIQRRDEEIIQEFCNEVGVDRGVLKVWMHNNKNTFAKKDQDNGGSSEGIEGQNNKNINIDSNGLNHEDNNNNNNNNNDDKGQNLNNHFGTHSVDHVGTNGSSSSS